MSALVATDLIDSNHPGSFCAALASVLATLAVSGAAAHRLTGRSFRLLAISPFSLAAVTWLVLFVLRPVELYLFPDHAFLALGQLGFELGDLSRSVAIGGLGAATWCGGYLLALNRPVRAVPARSEPRPFRLSVWGAVVALALGTLLWGVLFLRQGGISALVGSPASIRVEQGASFYAFLGVWVIEGTGLCALLAVLTRPTRAAKVVLLAAVALTLAAAVALQLRSLIAFGVLAALVIYLRLRRPSRRAVAIGLALLVIGAQAFGVLQTFRAYTAGHSTRDAVELTRNTPLWAMYGSDLSTFDNLVAVQTLVPESIDYLRGESLMEVPGAFVPRSLWPDKPRGLDFLAASYLYPGVYVAVPVSLQGELYWNGALPFVGAGAFVVGLLMGAVARVGLGARPVSVLFILYAMTFPFTHGFLRSSLATITANYVLALIGVSLAVLAVGLAREPLRGLSSGVAALRRA